MPLTWKHLVTLAKSEIEPPPVGSLISTYALDVAPDGRVLYYCEPEDDQRGAELWAFDGSAWKRLHEKRLTRLDHLESGGYDTSRDAFCVFGWDFDSQTRKWIVQSFAIGLDGKERELTFAGEHPVTEDDEIDPGTFDARGAFVFDPTRSVWVCFTRFGIWELDSSGAWTKKRDRGTDSWHHEWSSETGNAFFDPLGKRTVFWMQEGEDYELQAWAWDGAKLTAISMKSGLPKLTHGFVDVSCQLGGHPNHGVLLQVEGQVFALEGTSKWKRLPAEGNGPPRMEHGNTAFSPKHGWFLGPAKHAKSGNAFQRMFFVLNDRQWSTHGLRSVPSELAASGYGKVFLGHADGEWLATSTTGLRTWRREGQKWNELIDDKAGDEIIGRNPLSLVWDEKRLWAINWKGAIAEWSAGKWKVICKGDPLFKEKRDFSAAFDAQGRLVLWGGTSKNRKANDTLIFENGKWRAVKKPSPQPADFKHGKDGVYVDFQMVFDGTLGRFVRFGLDEVAVQQDDETWAPVKVKNYTKSISERAYGHVPAFDPTTGETLLLDFENARIVRFDLAGCSEVETIEWPQALLPKKQHDKAAHHRISDSFSYDPKTKTVYACDLENSESVFALELTSTFEKAKALGARRTLGPVSAATAAKKEKRVVYRMKNGVVVTAEQLDREALKAMVGVPAERISVGKAVKSVKAMPKSRVGGPAPAVVAKKWPKRGKEKMGFLFQLETGTLLKKHAGVAVFCTLDGEATTDDDYNAVVLLKAGDLAKTVAPPEGVPELPVMPITFEPLKVELDERRVVALGAKDATLAQVLEKFGTSKDVQESSAQKRGGVPQFLQGEVELKNWKFIAQLDFDVLDVSKTWDEAGLAGCVYVFVKDDEKDAFAMWQYT